MQCVSRSGIVHGQKKSAADEGNGRKRNQDAVKARREDVWYDFDRVLLVSSSSR
jgi:hypothetical protein